MPRSDQCAQTKQRVVLQAVGAEHQGGGVSRQGTGTQGLWRVAPSSLPHPPPPAPRPTCPSLSGGLGEASRTSGRKLQVEMLRLRETEICQSH